MQLSVSPAMGLQQASVARAAHFRRTAPNARAPLPSPQRLAPRPLVGIGPEPADVGLAVVTEEGLGQPGLFTFPSSAWPWVAASAAVLTGVAYALANFFSARRPPVAMAFMTSIPMSKVELLSAPQLMSGGCACRQQVKTYRFIVPPESGVHSFRSPPLSPIPPTLGDWMVGQKRPSGRSHLKRTWLKKKARKLRYPKE